MRIRMSALKLLQSFGGVAGTGAILFQFVHSKSRHPGNRQGEHLRPVDKTRQRPILLVRRASRRDEPHLVQLCLLPALLGHD